LLGLTADHVLLDAGCGCGELGEAVNGQVGGYCGIDVSLPCLASAREHCPRGSFVCGDLTCLPLRGAFDVVVAVTSLEFVCNKALALAQLRSVLRPGGRLYVEVRNEDFLLYRIIGPLRSLLRRMRWLDEYGADGFRDLSVRQWRTLLNEAGFNILHQRQSLRPVLRGGAALNPKNLAIALVRAVVPNRWHYMIGFVCVTAECGDVGDRSGTRE